MLKKIHVDHIVTGMFIKEFCGSWMEHPFWRTSFVINDPKDIETIRASSIKEVWIDSDLGVDVFEPQFAVMELESEEEVEDVLNLVATVSRKLEKVSVDEEIARASVLCAKSKQAVISMFSEVRMGKTVDTEVAQRLVDEISDSISRNAGALISLARLKTADDYTYMHSVAVCALMMALGRQLALDEGQIRQVGMAGLMHDLGKAMMPNAILNKPGKLTAEEFDIIKGHPAEGHRLLQQVASVDMVTLDVCLHHHEKMDSSGYPEGLKGEAISLYARMGAVCDVYDAITSNRPYKSGWDPAYSIRKMAEWAEGHFDQRVFQAFVKSLGIYPIGSLVRLNCGKIGVVIEQSQRSLLTPLVKVFYSTISMCRIAPNVIDLSRPHATESIVAREDPNEWQFPDLDELWSGQADPRL